MIAGNTVSVYAGFPEGLSPGLEVEICPTSVFWSDGRLARFRSLDHGVVYGELELGTKFKRTLSPRANFRDTSEIRRIFIIHYRILELT